MSCILDIKVLSGTSAGDVFHYTLELNEQLLIGRSIECNLVLQDTHISRKHLSILYKNGSLYLIDLGSTHGTVHMGFKVKPGEENARQINNGDEFKLGDLLFQVNCELPSSLPERQSEQIKIEKKDLKTAIPERWKNFIKKNKILIIIALVGLFLLLFIPDKRQALPPQRSNQVLLLPNYGAVGYFRSDLKDENDQTHLDRAQFELPASDALIEYSYTSKMDVSLKIDDIEIEKLPPSSSWKRRQLIVRGLGLGTKRKLVFDNLNYPVSEQSLNLEQQLWAVKDVRALPLSRSGIDAANFLKEMDTVLALVEGVDKTPDGLFLLLRSTQIALVTLLEELKIDAIGIEINLETQALINFSDISSLRQRLEQIKTTYQSSTVNNGLLLTNLNKIISEIDGELWRRLNSRLTQAKLAAKVKNYIEAHDNLLSALKMFPEEADYRWSLANKLFQNNNIVPRKFRDKPEKFRKNG